MCFEKLKVPQEYELILLDFWSLPGNSLGWEPSYKEQRGLGVTTVVLPATTEPSLLPIGQSLF